jgi:cytochrome c-type biogenesis protein
VSTSIAFAFGAGLLATVNPCGFAMLPSFLSLYLGSRDDAGGPDGVAARAAQGFVVGVVLSAAFGAVFLGAGLIVSAGLRSFLDVVPWLATLIGVALLVVGLAMLAGRHVGLASASRIGVQQQAGQGLRRVAVFGVTYALASLSCTLAVFLIVIGQALAAANPFELLAVFGAYAAGSASVLIALSMSAALAKGTLERALRRTLPVISRIAGGLLALSGVYLILYWLPALGGGTASADSWAARTTEGVSSALAEFFRANTSVFAAVLAAVTVLGAALLLTQRGRREDGDDDGEPFDDCCAPVAPLDGVADPVGVRR